MFDHTKFFILLALAEGPLGGSAIQGAVIGDSLGACCVRESSLYDAIKWLMGRGLVDCLSEPGVFRKIYCLTPEGRRRLENQLGMYAWVLRKARERYLEVR